MPKTETGKGSFESKPGFPPTGKKALAKQSEADQELLQSVSNRLSILEEKFDRLVKSHRFQF